MKKGTGKIRTARKARPPKPLPAFDVQLRYDIEQTRQFLKNSRPTVYKLIEQGLLETIREGRRIYITGRSIAARCSPAG